MRVVHPRTRTDTTDQCLKNDHSVHIKRHLRIFLPFFSGSKCFLKRELLKTLCLYVLSLVLKPVAQLHGQDP